ncbi:MAG: AMP-binding protein, partial [Bacteroidota bacterium]
MSYRNLVEALFASAMQKEKGIVFINGTYQEDFLSYSELLEHAQSLLCGLQQNGLQSGQELVIQLDNNQTFLEVFWAALLGGMIPIPLELARNEATVNKLLKVWANLADPVLIHSGDRLALALGQLGDEGIPTDRCFDVDQLYAKASLVKVFDPDPSDIAFIQFSSGSTGQPKGVVLSHANLLANIEAIHAGIDSPPEGDLFMSWMPLTHDMGLIGFHLTPLVAGWQHFIIPSRLFVRTPNLWLHKLSEHRITFSASPNFGYHFVLKYFEERNTTDLDLSALRVIVNGAEPISFALCQQFVEKMRPFGLRETVIFPVYGLAEASLAVTFSDVHEVPKALLLDRQQLGIGQQIRAVAERGVHIVNVGRAVRHVDLRIVDNRGKKLDVGYIGHIHIKGKNVSAGYYRNAAANKKVHLPDNWLDTGDLGFVHQGDLYITGRVKEIFFINGQNYYPHDIEQVIARHLEITTDKVVIMGFWEERSQENKVICFMAYRKKETSFIELSDRIRRLLSQQVGLDLSICIPVKRIPKTTSGKLQRVQLLNAYKEGHYTELLQRLSNYRRINEKPNTHPARNQQDRTLLAIWEKVFGRTDIGLDDALVDLGVNSLKLGQLSGL